MLSACCILGLSIRDQMLTMTGVKIILRWNLISKFLVACLNFILRAYAYVIRLTTDQNNVNFKHNPVLIITEILFLIYCNVT